MLQMMNLKQNKPFSAYLSNMLINVRPYSARVHEADFGCIWENTEKPRRLLCVDIL